MSFCPPEIVTVAEAVKSTPKYEPVVNGEPAGPGLHVTSNLAPPDVKPYERFEPLPNVFKIGIRKSYLN
jgi:hypothetical protein